MELDDLKQFNLPDSPGVYFFYSKKELLYVGKATSLKDRVKSYFSRDILLTRGPKIVKMLEDAERVEFMQTDSVLEALILEANQIKKHQPPANTKDKDDKSYYYVTLTEEEFPKVTITRGSGTYGPFPHSTELKEGLKIVRKIFPFRDDKCKLGGKPCFNAQLGLCPGPCAGWITKTEYRKVIRNFSLFFEGKKEKVILNLEKEMKALAKAQEFESAEKVKRKIFALDHIQDIALIKQDLTSNLQTSNFRIEAYDIAHISGTNVVGVMTVVENGEANKSQYRKFKIKIDKNDDVKNLQEILIRRFNHPEWRMPNLIVVDGGSAQLNVAQKLTDIPIVAVTKDDKHKAKQIIPKSNILNQESERAVLLANSEAHRFAINYHRKLRSKGFRI
ncbi:MAG: GIY-YIG nuclease family protein [Patescibacteria group bacterium]